MALVTTCWRITWVPSTRDSGELATGPPAPDAESDTACGSCDDGTAAGYVSDEAQGCVERFGLCGEICGTPLAEVVQIGELLAQGRLFGGMLALHQRPVRLGVHQPAQESLLVRGQP